MKNFNIKTKSFLRKIQQKLKKRKKRNLALNKLRFSANLKQNYRQRHKKRFLRKIKLMKIKIKKLALKLHLTRRHKILTIKKVQKK